jgi:branched-chain amino acid aminotransferase
MSILLNLNGVITPPEDAKISVLDHAVLFGDSVYETVRTYNGRPFLFSRHFARLQHSAERVHLVLPWSKEAIRGEVQRTLESKGYPGESRIRVMVTRGAGALNLDIETTAGPSLIIIVVPLQELPPARYRDGVNVVISSVRRGRRLADIKTGSLIHQVLAFNEAKAKKAFEAILLTDEGHLSDGITSNIYLVEDQRLLTPSHDAGIVEGITRGVVLELARGMGLEVIEGMFPQNRIDYADEMLLTSTTREVVPIVRVDGRTVGSGKPGPVAEALLKSYRAAIAGLLEEG